MCYDKQYARCVNETIFDVTGGSSMSVLVSILMVIVLAVGSVFGFYNGMVSEYGEGICKSRKGSVPVSVRCKGEDGGRKIRG